MIINNCIISFFHKSALRMPSLTELRVVGRLMLIVYLMLQNQVGGLKRVCVSDPYFRPKYSIHFYGRMGTLKGTWIYFLLGLAE